MGLFGFFGCLRSSELVALTLADIEQTSQGFLVRAARIKSGGKNTTFLLPFDLQNSSLSPGAIVQRYLDKVGSFFYCLDTPVASVKEPAEDMAEAKRRHVLCTVSWWQLYH